jgi:hypothetical protein
MACTGTALSFMSEGSQILAVDELLNQLNVLSVD